MNWFPLFLKSSIGKKTIAAVTGSMLCLFILVHMLGNTTIFFGRTAFLSYAHHLHSLGPLVRVVEFGLMAAFLCHIIMALFLNWENYQARPGRYAVKKSRGGRTLGSRTMPYTGLWILVFLVIHLLNFTFSQSSLEIADLVRDVLRTPGYAVYYMITMLALALHVSHGFWSMFQSLGLNQRKYNTLLERSALAFSIAVGTIFILIPAMALFSGKFLL